MTFPAVWQAVAVDDDEENHPQGAPVRTADAASPEENVKVVTSEKPQESCDTAPPIMILRLLLGVW
eukprot:CAMPEP_0119012746 /NCGR_PEP_ID=MMETSP1176-20130426/7439_1 /TAXON_ID=265551 /ORGANISM="Synedropsis recta cf, Strain CCMP1620" /LENGTH=65 /DNA_ID=CAMNT_0006965765 /DNA_START=92 /DNA_END=286 /DNA_ORIENTATION=+